jgi:phosphate transport system substrate-binding protein
VIVAACVAGMGAAACGGPSRTELTGAGATFPYPVYARWIAAYGARTGVRINYQAIGSGGGIRQLAEGTVDFGATDVPMSPGELAGARAGGVLHLPMLVGAVAVTYNLPGLAAPLRLSPELLAELFLGRVARWDDPRVASLNPGSRLPALDVLVVHRAEGSGTTFVLTDYLSAVSPAWATGPGRGKDVRWPTGIGGRGTEGVAGLVERTPGAIGYVEATAARRGGLPVALVRNRDGAFVAPGGASVAAAAAAVTGAMPSGADFRISLVDAPGAASYPIASFTWLLLDAAPRDTAAAREVVAFARWALRDGPATALSMGYAPLPAPLAARVDARLAALPWGA